MEAFEYANPAKKEQVVELLAGEWGKTAVLAGGTDLLSLMKDTVETPARVVSLGSVEELRGISLDGSGLRLGALATLEELLEHAQVRKEYPALTQAAEGVTSSQIRSRGTVGGDLCQRPRCWYYRGGFGLLAKGEDGKSLVPGGDNRYHAILGNRGPAYFVNPLEPGSGVDRARRPRPDSRSERLPRGGGRAVFHLADERRRSGKRSSV